MFLGMNGGEVSVFTWGCFVVFCREFMLGTGLVNLWLWLFYAAFFIDCGNRMW